MRKAITTMVLVALGLTSIAHGQAEPVRVESRIVGAAMFKNGLAVIRREVTLPGVGVFEALDVPDPVHGTFWIESDAVVTTRVTSHRVEVPDAAPGWDVQRELAGSDVVIMLKEQGKPAIIGKVLDFSAGEDANRTWNRTYETDRYGQPLRNWNYGGGWNVPAVAAAPRFVVLATHDGRAYVDASSIASIEVTGPPRTPTRLQNVMEFAVTKPAGTEGSTSRLVITYLAKGLTWAPSYHVDLAESTSMNLEQQAVIRNELEDLRDVELQLISGYPSIEFSHVTSPLSPRTNLASFLQQLAQNNPSSWQAAGAVSQQRVADNFYVNDGSNELDVAPPVGEGVDLHYQSIGRHTLLEGDSLMLSVASGTAEYKRIVEWLIPDSRNEDGYRITESMRESEPQKYDDAPWDAVAFHNPLPFAMTTAPAMILDNGRFAGQRTSTWINSGERGTLRVNKALSIRTRNIETEEPDTRVNPFPGCPRCVRVTVNGEVSATNHRAERVTLNIRRRFSGELLSADESPKSVLLEEGAYSVNPRNELVWTVELDPGAQKTLKYRYTVLSPQ